MEEFPIKGNTIDEILEASQAKRCYLSFEKEIDSDIVCCWNNLK